MKNLLIIISIAVSFALGYLIAPKVQIVQGIDDNQVTIENEDSPKNEYEYKSESQEKQKDSADQLVHISDKKLSESNVKNKEVDKRKKMQKHFEYLIKSLPFSFVKRRFYDQSEAVEKAAMERFNYPDKKDFEGFKEYQKEVFEILKPIASKHTHYKAEGVLNYKDLSFPYKLILDFDNRWGEKSKRELKNPNDFSFMVTLLIDTSPAPFGSKLHYTASGYGIFGVVNDGGRVFLKTYTYPKDEVNFFDNAIYYLVEPPSSEEVSTKFQLFDSVEKRWVLLTDQVNFQKITEEEYKKLKSDAYKQLDSL